MTPPTLAEWRAARENIPSGRYSPSQTKELDAADRRAEAYLRDMGSKLLKSERARLQQSFEELHTDSRNVTSAWGVLIEQAQTGRITADQFRESARALHAQSAVLRGAVDDLRADAARFAGRDPFAFGEEQLMRFPMIRRNLDLPLL